MVYHGTVAAVAAPMQGAQIPCASARSKLKGRSAQVRGRGALFETRAYRSYLWRVVGELSRLQLSPGNTLRCTLPYTAWSSSPKHRNCRS